MTRRIDRRTAEIIDVALLARAAFEPSSVAIFLESAGVPDELVQRVFSRLPNELRPVGMTCTSGVSADRRRRREC